MALRLSRVSYVMLYGIVLVSALSTAGSIDSDIHQPGPTVESDREANSSTYIPINITSAMNSSAFTPVRNISSTTSPQTTPFLPDDISQLSCAVIKKEFGSYNFHYKYTKEQLQAMVCRCSGICVKVTLSPEGKKEIHDNLYGPLSERNKPTFIAVVTAYSALFLVGLAGNITTLVGLIRWVKKSTPTFLFICSLSCSDLLLLIVCMPLKITEYFYLADIFTEATCKLSYYVRDFTLVCSVLTLTVISFERYYAICHPLKVQYRCTWRRAKIVILITWLVSACLALPTIFMTKFYLPLGMIRHECLQQSSDDLHLQLYFIYYLGVLFVVPLTTMLYTYGRSCYGLWKSAQHSEAMQGKSKKIGGGMRKLQENQEPDVGFLKARQKVIKLLVLVVALFAVCWGPPLIVQLLSVMEVVRRHRQKVRLGVETLTYISSALNPYLFIAMSSQFRKSICWCLVAVSRKRRGMYYQSTFRETTFTSGHATSASTSVHSVCAGANDTK